MVIEEEDFKMELVEDSNRYDLYTIYVVNAKIPEKRREELKLIGYAMSIEKCIDLIIMNRLKKKKEIYSLKEFISEYKEETKKLRDSINTKL